MAALRVLFALVASLVIGFIAAAVYHGHLVSQPPTGSPYAEAYGRVAEAFIAGLVVTGIVLGLLLALRRRRKKEE